MERRRVHAQHGAQLLQPGLWHGFGIALPLAVVPLVHSQPAGHFALRQAGRLAKHAEPLSQGLAVL